MQKIISIVDAQVFSTKIFKATCRVATFLRSESVHSRQHSLRKKIISSENFQQKKIKFCHGPK